VQGECEDVFKGVGLEDEKLYNKLARYCIDKKMSGREIKFLCTEAIGKMLDEMNQGLEKLAEESYEKIRVHELKTRELKEEGFGGIIIQIKSFPVLLSRQIIKACFIRQLVIIRSL
jgi:hypothetical protein